MAISKFPIKSKATKHMKRLLITFLVSMFIFSCQTEDEPQPIDEMREPVVNVAPPQNATSSKMGTFVGYAHALSGKSLLYTDATNSRTLRLEEFTMTPGPDVFVFLSKSNNYSKANVISLVKLNDGYNKSSLNIAVDPSIDLSTHKFVLVYCVQFSSLFGYAELK